MNYFSHCLFCLMLGNAFLCAEELQAPPKKLSFAQAQAATLKHSEELSIAELETWIATEKIEEIRGINLPKLSAHAAYDMRDKHAGFVRKNPMYKKEAQRPSPSLSESPSPPPPPQPKTITTLAANKEIRSAKLSLVVPVYDFGYVSNLMKAQRSVVEATVHERERVQQDLLYGVANSFYRALEGAKIESVVIESIRILEQQLATARDLFSVGLVTKNDVLVVDVQLAERQQELIQARHTIESALATLSRLTGLQLRSVAELDDVEDQVTWDSSVDAIIAQADAVHPVLKKICAHTAAATFDVAATKAENYPDINAFVDLHTSSDSYLLHKRWIHSGIGIEIPIFDGGIVNSKVAQKRKEISALDLRYREAVEDIHLAIQKAFLQVESAFSQLPVALQSIKLAEDNLAISRDLFAEGLIMSDDVLNDEGRLAQARSNYYQSLYDFYIAKSELDYAAGCIQPEGIKNVG